jgi:hypothetical protein
MPVAKAFPPDNKASSDRQTHLMLLSLCAFAFQVFLPVVWLQSYQGAISPLTNASNPVV